MRFDGVPTPGEQVIPQAHNIFKIFVLLALLFSAFIAGSLGAQYLAAQSAALDPRLGTGLLWGWLIVMGTVASFAAQGLGILAHDAVHKVLFRRRWANELVGGLISAFSLLPFNANRQFHLAHHRCAHQPDRDPEQPMHRHPLLFAISGGSLIGLFLQYRILAGNLFNPQVEARRRVGALKDLGYLALAWGIYGLFLQVAGISVWHSLVPLLLTLPLVFGIRAISDHYGLPAVERDQVSTVAPARANPVLFEVGGWVIRTHPLLEWLWSNVNYHEVHHKFPYLSHCHLKSVFAATREELPYAVAEGYLKNLWNHRNRTYYSATRPNNESAAGIVGP